MLYKVKYEGEKFILDPLLPEKEVSSWITSRIEDYIERLQQSLAWKQRRVVDYSSWTKQPSMQTEEAQTDLQLLISRVKEDVSRTELSIKQAQTILKERNND